MKNMLSHSFVLDALDTTAADTFSHFEMLIEEHIEMSKSQSNEPSRLKKLVPTVGTFHTALPLRKAFVAYNKKYALTKRRHITISFNELRHIMNLAQIMALHNGDDGDKDISSSLERWEKSPGPLVGIRPPSPPQLSLGVSQAEEKGQCPKEDFGGPKMITFDGDQTLYSDGANFESNQELASYLYLLLKNGVTIAVVTAAGYEYQREKYELRLSGLLKYFKARKLPARDCERFFLFGGECNYLLTVSVILLFLLHFTNCICS
jgi:IMP and pyridine-specific 5'-nucleotidase